jgi:hypothetical protein
MHVRCAPAVDDATLAAVIPSSAKELSMGNRDRQRKEPKKPKQPKKPPTPISN